MPTKKTEAARAMPKKVRKPAPEVQIQSTMQTLVSYREKGCRRTFIVGVSEDIPGGVRVDAPCGEEVHMKPAVARAVAKAVLAAIGE